MISAPLVIAVSAGYLLVLFAIAAFGDRRASRGRSILGSGWIYALSLAVYCSAWTYFGSVGRAATSGIWFLPIYLGPMLAMILAWILVRKMIRISQTYRITSIADFVASRYGKSPVLAALVTIITVIGIVPYIALQLKAVSAGYDLLTAGPGADEAPLTAWWWDGTLYVALALAAFTMIFGTRHLDSAERHEGMVAAVAFESVIKLVAFLAVGGFVTWGLFDGMGDIWSQAQAFPELRGLLRLGGESGAGAFGFAQWFALTLLAMLSVMLLPRQFQMMIVECVDEQHLRRAAWVFPGYLLLINVFVLPIAIGGLLLSGAGGGNPETFLLSLPLENNAPGLALFAYVGGLSAATGMLIVETLAVATMVCNDLVMPSLLRLPRFGARARGDLTQVLLNIRRAAVLGVLMLGYLYFRVAGEAYALVSIGLISFAAVAQFAPALLVGMYWRGGTRMGALGGLLGGFALWVYTLMLPSIAGSGWMLAGFVEHGPFGLEFLAPERLFGLTGLDPLTHALFWSLLVNVALYAGLSLWKPPTARDASQALLFVDVFKRGENADGLAPVFWRGHARLEDLTSLAERLLGETRARLAFEEYAREVGVAGIIDIVPDARLVDRVERQIAGAVGSASARVMISSIVQEEPLVLDDVIEILEETSQLRGYARALEEKSHSLELATSKLRAANEDLKALDILKDEFVSSVTHELRTPLTSIRALSELMLDEPGMDVAQREQFMRIVLSEAERLSRLVNQVLDMAKIDSGLADWRSEDVDVRELIENAVLTTSELFRERGAQVAMSLSDRVPTIRADADRLTQVLVNLLSNAAKFVPAQGGEVTVALRMEAKHLVVEVCDNGPGVPPGEQESVFERFRQGGEAASRPSGTGLGLPISRQIVEHFGGTIWLNSTPGGGACFAFRLPLGTEGEDTR